MFTIGTKIAAGCVLAVVALLWWRQDVGYAHGVSDMVAKAQADKIESDKKWQQKVDDMQSMVNTAASVIRMEKQGSDEKEKQLTRLLNQQGSVIGSASLSPTAFDCVQRAIQDPNQPLPATCAGLLSGDAVRPGSGSARKQH